MPSDPQAGRGRSNQHIVSGTKSAAWPIHIFTNLLSPNLCSFPGPAGFSAGLYYSAEWA